MFTLCTSLFIFRLNYSQQNFMPILFRVRWLDLLLENISYFGICCCWPSLRIPGRFWATRSLRRLQLGSYWYLTARAGYQKSSSILNTKRDYVTQWSAYEKLSDNLNGFTEKSLNHHQPCQCWRSIWSLKHYLRNWMISIALNSKQFNRDRRYWNSHT